MLETCTKKYTSSADFYLTDSPIELPVMDFTMKAASEETDFILGDEFILGDKKSRCMDSIEVQNLFPLHLKAFTVSPKIVKFKDPTCFTKQSKPIKVPADQPQFSLTINISILLFH